MAILAITEENFQAEVVNSDKTVLLEFWAPWCGPCRMVAPAMDEIAAEFSDIKVGKINVDEQMGLAVSFGAESIPMFVVMKGGKVTNGALGARPKGDILKLIGK